MNFRFFRLISPFVIFAFFILAGCGEQYSLQKTDEGIPRKVVIKADDTPIYSSDSLNDRITYAHQWEIFYIFGEGDSFFVISSNASEVSDPPYHVKKSDVFEWNTHIALSFTNSPHEADREPLYCYETLDGAIAEDIGERALREKPEHETDFNPMHAEPILREYANSFYYLAALYDDINEDGEYVFLGHYDFCYQQYDPRAQGFKRYVSRARLSDQMVAMMDATGNAKANMDPSELDEIYGPIADLLNLQRNVDGVKEIQRAFSGPDVPDEAQGGIFAEERLQGRDYENIDPELWSMIDLMREYSLDDSKWNDDGYGYVPAEWLE